MQFFLQNVDDFEQAASRCVLFSLWRAGLFNDLIHLEVLWRNHSNPERKHPHAGGIKTGFCIWVRRGQVTISKDLTNFNQLRQT